MANNRLYIVDSATHKKILLAKTFGDGWVIPDNQLDKINDFLDTADIEASYGTAESSDLLLLTEFDIED